MPTTLLLTLSPPSLLAKRKSFPFRVYPSQSQTCVFSRPLSVVLKGFKKFDDTTKAVAAAAAICDGKLDKTLKKFLKASMVDKEVSDKLALIDSKLGGRILSFFFCFNS